MSPSHVKHAPPISFFSMWDIKILVKVNLKFTIEQAVQAQRESRGIAYSFFNLGARWAWVVNASPRKHCPRERRSTHRTGDWVDPRASLDGCWKSCCRRDWIPGPSCP
jgi:hypothetical protein